MGPSIRRHPVRLFIVLALVAQGLAWTATSASADPAASTTTLIQGASTVIYGAESADIFGVTVTGATAGAAPTGAVTVTDTVTNTVLCSATLENTTADISSAECALTDDQIAGGTTYTGVVATYGGDANNGGSVSTPAQTLAVQSSTQTTQDQDAAVVANLDDTYSSELSTATVLGQASGLEDMTDFESQVQELNSTGLAQFYSLTQQVPQWDSIPGQMQTIAADLPPGTTSGLAQLQSLVVKGNALGARAAGPGAAGGRATRSAVLANSEPTPTPYSPQSCPSAPPEAAIFAAQIVIDVAGSAYNASQIIGEAEILGVDFAEGSAIAALILAVVLGVAQIIHDTLVYLQDLAKDCAFTNLANQVDNIDNTTVQTYGLIGTTNSLIVELQATQATTQQDVENIVNSGLNSFQTTIQQAIQINTQTLEATAGGGTQGSSTELQVIQTALQSDATSIEQTETTEGQQVVGGNTTINADLATELSSVLSETDSDAKGLTTLITQESQQILNTLSSQAAMTQTQYNNLLRLQIEQALAGWGPVVPEVKFMLPASLGGFLNSTPVSVQSVVTQDLTAIQSDGGKIKPSALTSLSAANTALAAGQWTTAWADYAAAYQALA